NRPNGQIWAGVVGSPTPPGTPRGQRAPERWFVIWLGSENNPVDKAAAVALAEAIRPWEPPPAPPADPAGPQAQPDPDAPPARSAGGAGGAAGPPRSRRAAGRPGRGGAGPGHRRAAGDDAAGLSGRTDDLKIRSRQRDRRQRAEVEVTTALTSFSRFREVLR